jgi:hypothetical protein
LAIISARSINCCSVSPRSPIGKRRPSGRNDRVVQRHYFTPPHDAAIHFDVSVVLVVIGFAPSDIVIFIKLTACRANLFRNLRDMHARYHCEELAKVSGPSCHSASKDQRRHAGGDCHHAL